MDRRDQFCKILKKISITPENSDIVMFFPFIYSFFVEDASVTFEIILTFFL